MTHPPKLRIGYISEGVYTRSDGVASYMHTLGEYFRSLGHEVTTIVSESRVDDPSVRAIGRTAIVSMNHSQTGLPIYVAKTTADKVATELALDVAHVQIPESPFSMGRLVQSIKKVKPAAAVVATSHSVPATRLAAFNGRLLGQLYQAGIYRAQTYDQILSVSTAAQTCVRDYFGLESTVLPCPVNVAKFETGKKLEAYADGKTNLVFLGKLVKRKSCNRLLEAVSLLPPNILENTRLLIGGEGPERASLESQARQLGLANLIHFVGHVPEEDKPDFLATADMAVFPSDEGESSGIVLAEAMAAGAGVVIGNNNVGYRETLAATPQALVTSRDTAGFAWKLLEFMTDPELRERTHAVQRAVVRRDYDITVVGPQLEAIYRGILEARAS